MIINFWNIRGLDDPIKSKEVRKLVREKDISVLALLETRVRKHNK